MNIERVRKNIHKVELNSTAEKKKKRNEDKRASASIDEVSE
jgi:hypothetical protein